MEDREKNVGNPGEARTVGFQKRKTRYLPIIYVDEYGVVYQRKEVKDYNYDVEDTIVTVKKEGYYYLTETIKKIKNLRKKEKQLSLW